MKKTIFILLGILVLAACGLYVRDLVIDRSKAVKVLAVVSLYRDWEPLDDANQPEVLGKVNPGESLKVLRVRFGKDYEAVKVERQDGSTGWLKVQSKVVEVE